MDLQKEIKDLETKLTPTDAKGIGMGLVNVLKIGCGHLEDKELVQDIFQLGTLHYMTFVESAMKNAAKNKSINGPAPDTGPKDPVVGDTDQPDQVCERD